MKFRISFTSTLSAALLLLMAVSLAAQDTTEPVSQSVEEQAGSTLPMADNKSTSIQELEILTVPMTAEDLAALATVWQGHVKSSLEAVASLNLAIQASSDNQDAALRDQLTDRTAEKKSIEDKYQTVLDAWQRKGAPEGDIALHLNYLAALNRDAVRSTDPRTLIKLATGWLFSTEGGFGMLLKMLGFVAGIWGMIFIARFLRRATQRGLSRIPTLSRLLQGFIVTAVFWASFVLGTVMLLAIFGVNVTPLFAVFGGISFILGFALQETLGNLASGLMIMVLRPFDTGDYIIVGGVSGSVDNMSVVTTQIRTFDNQIIVVPNSKIWGDVITNVNASAERRVDLVFGIGYSDNAQLAIDVLKELVEAHPKCLKEPQPQILVGELGDSSVNIFCRPWSKTEDYWTVYWDLTMQTKERFDKEGISIPFPQRDVHLIQSNEQPT